MILALVLVLAAAVVMGLGGVLFGVAFRSLGDFAPTGGFLFQWALHPVILLALALGIVARVLHYATLSFFNVSQVTLFSALSIVATLVLARVVLGEELSRIEIVGSILIVAGVSLIGR